MLCPIDAVEQGCVGWGSSCGSSSRAKHRSEVAAVTAVMMY